MNSEIKPVSIKTAEELVKQQINQDATLDSVSDYQAKMAYRAEAAQLRAALEALQAENAELKEDLQFVERWANHHAAHPNISAKEALSVIQHYPSIEEITKSYKDGVIPNTRNPYAEIEALRKQVEILQRPLDDEIISRIIVLVKNVSDEELASNVFESVRNMTNWNKSTPAEYLALFDKTSAQKGTE